MHPPPLQADPVAKSPYINKPLLFLTPRRVLLALLEEEEENRPGKREVMSRSECQKQRPVGLRLPDPGKEGMGLGAPGVGCVWQVRSHLSVQESLA